MTHYLYVFGVQIEAESQEEIADLADQIEVLTEFSRVGHVTAAELVKKFDGDVDRILSAGVEELLEVPGVGEQTAQNLVDKISSVEDEIRRTREDHSPTLDELEMEESEGDGPDETPFDGRMEVAEGE